MIGLKILVLSFLAMAIPASIGTALIKLEAMPIIQFLFN